MVDKNNKIVILEDEDFLGKLYKKKLEEEGYDVTHYSEIDELINNLKESIDLFLLDNTIKGDKRGAADIVPKIKSVASSAKIIILSNSHTDNKNVDGVLLKIDTPPAALVVHVNKLFTT